jgi:hypothetical protein
MKMVEGESLGKEQKRGKKVTIRSPIAALKFYTRDRRDRDFAVQARNVLRFGMLFLTRR